MGTIQDPGADRDWLKRSYADTSGNPFTVEAQAEQMGRLVDGTGDSRMARVGRVVIRVSVWITLAAIFLSLLAELLNQPG